MDSERALIEALTQQQASRSDEEEAKIHTLLLQLRRSHISASNAIAEYLGLPKIDRGVFMREVR